MDADGNEIGTIDLKLVSTTEATNKGVDLLMVCDADSTILTSVYSTLFDANGEEREELEISPGWNDLLLIENITMPTRDEISSRRVQLIEAAIATFCTAGIVVADEPSLELGIEEWRLLGFKRIVESPFVYRDQTRLNPYQRSNIDAFGESRYTCGACGEEVVVPVDPSQGLSQEYVEDCPVCCRANVIRVDIDDDGEVVVWAELEQDEDGD